MEAFFWLVYTISALAAFYHSFRVFSLSDPWYVALLSAVAIDGLTFFSMAALGKWTGKQRLTGFIGVLLFATISALAQVIWRYEAQGIALPEFLRVVSLALVPMSTTGAVVALGLMHYFGANKVSPPVETIPTKFSLQQELSADVEKSVSTEKEQLTIANVSLPTITDSQKRKPGRPPKVAFARDVESPKSLKS